jgi:transposase-like protein
MRREDFDVLLELMDQLSVEQHRRLKDRLSAGDSEAAVVALVEGRLGDQPSCVHCTAPHEQVRRWGHSHGLQRWRCGSCGRTFNALTGTPLARLRKKACWLRFAETLSEGLTVKAAAARCGIHPTTSFRWRHRFLRAEITNSEPLGGIVEADETFFRLSFKGSRQWQSTQHQGTPQQTPGPPPLRPPKRRGMKASMSGTSHEQVAVLVARDRSGNGRSIMLPRHSGEAIDEAIGAALPRDAILCTDASRSFAKTVRTRRIRHEIIHLNKGERIRDDVWHIQNANALHGRLKHWVRHFKGVATRYLPNYLAWHHIIERHHQQPTQQVWIETAINS